jgi:DNA polymerase
MGSDIRSELGELTGMVKRYLEQQVELGLTEVPRRVRAESGSSINAQGLPLLSGLSMPELRKMAEGCRKCAGLCNTRTKVVFGSGDEKAKLVFVGEAPGYNEDQQGLPFVGRAGQLLDKILAAIDMNRNEVYITNILKCRPPENRNPLDDEIANCEPYLLSQLDLIKPKLICALGTYAAQTLLRTKTPISKMRGRFHLYHNILLMPTYHPAFLLRNPSFKKDVWEDMKLLKAKYDELSK